MLQTYFGNAYTNQFSTQQHVMLPKYRELIDEIEISHSDAGKIFDAFGE